MRAANEKFRAARQRTASEAHPKECLSRQELAELANTWIWDRHHKKYELTGNYIGKLEQGVIRWPSALYREAFRAILSVPTDSVLGFVNARARSRRAVMKLDDVDDVKRRQAIETTTVGLGTLALQGPVVALLEDRSEPTRIPRRVGATDINQIRTTTQVFHSLSRTYGGGIVRDAAMAHLRYSAGLLDATCPDRLRPELHSALGALADCAGWMAVDADAHEEARRVYRFALYCAEQAKNWNLRAEVLSSMTKQEIWTGQPDEGLTFAELGLVRPDRLTATIQALLHTDRARALAKMRRVQEALRAVGTADEHFTHSTPENDPPSLYYNAPRHAQLTGQPLVDLAILGRDPGEATDRLTAAATGHTDTEDTRSRAICLTKLASLTMATGDPLQAASIGHQALDITGTLRSHRATEGLRELHCHAAAHQNLEEVEHLRHRIATLVGTDNP